ncbi:MAG: hypothetical protein AAF558_02185 [Verrucomicrobiota bacterium]
MSNTTESLARALEIDGALGAAIGDYKSGMCLGAEGNPGFDLETAIAANTEVIRAKLSAMEQLGINGGIEDILITLDSQYHLIRLVQGQGAIFIYLALSTDKANLAMARHKLASIETDLEI